MSEPCLAGVTSNTLAGTAIGKGRKRIALTRLKIAAFDPIPSASDKIAMAVKPGVFSIDRIAYRISLTRFSIVFSLSDEDHSHGCSPFQETRCWTRAAT